jgi:hypothetical protein
MVAHKVTFLLGGCGVNSFRRAAERRPFFFAVSQPIVNSDEALEVRCQPLYIKNVRNPLKHLDQVTLQLRRIDFLFCQQSERLDAMSVIVWLFALYGVY